MSIHLNACQIKHERRARLVFDNTLAAGAFTSTAFYTVDIQAGVGAVPNVQAAFVVVGSPNVVELQLDVDLSQGCVYRFLAEGVPAADLSTTSAGSSAVAYFGQETRGTAASNTAAAASDLEITLYGEDILWSGTDWAETPDGDLATVAGITCAREDLLYRVQSNGLPWDPKFGPHAREFVDGAPGALTDLANVIASDAQKDDRVKTCSAVIDDSVDPPVLVVRPILIGDGAAALAPLRVSTSA